MIKSVKNYTFFLILIIILLGCSTSHLTYVGNDNWAATMSKSALTTGDLSYKSRYFLVKNALIDDYNNDHQKVIKTLALFVEHPSDKLIPGEDSTIEALSVLVELCTYEAQQTSYNESMKYWMSAAFYSYKYIFDKSLNQNATAYNALEYAADIRFYNYAVSKIYSYCADNDISLEEPQGFPLVIGIVKLSPVKSDLIWSYSRFDSYVNGYDYIPKNLQSHSYVAGLGVPILGLQKYTPGTKINKDLALVSMVYPFTFLIKFENFDLSKGSINAVPEFCDSFNDEYIQIDGQEIPLSKDYSLALAESTDSYESISGIKYMFNPAAMGDLQGLYFIAPYNPHKIPVLLVHGLMSNPGTWMEMLNTLLSDETIRENYQFWAYTYPTGQPIYFSEYQFRNSIMEVHQKYDPQSKDFAFNHMVIIGHSMGGILTRLSVQDSEGDYLVNKVTGADVSRLQLNEKEKQFLSDVGTFKPLPFVGCIILISTPNRGSEMATFTFSRIGSYFITLPTTVTQNSFSIIKDIAIVSGLHPDEDPIPNGIDSLAPSSKFLETSVDLPFKKNLDIHTIIGNQVKAGEKSGSDGVVPYSSAHLDYAQSELVVKSDHSAHQTAEGIKEVSRILLEYLNELDIEKSVDSARKLEKIPISTSSDSARQ